MSQKILNLFDFDGTITKKSTVTPFFVECAPWRAIVRHGWALLPAASLYVAGKKDFAEMLRRSTVALLARKDEALLKQVGASIAGKLVEAHLVWPQTLRFYRECVERGEAAAIVTGGYGYVAKAWLAQTGLPGVVHSSLVAFDEAGLASHCESVCVGLAKLAAVRAGRAEGYEIHAFGNSKGDYEMLSEADRAFWVDKNGSVAERPPATFLRRS